MSFRPIRGEQLTSLAAATYLTVPTGTVFTLIQAETANIRVKFDGTDPSESVGLLVAAGDTLEYSGDPTMIRLIQVSAGAVANVEYFGARQ